jgi:hypothetical protein
MGMAAILWSDLVRFGSSLSMDRGGCGSDLSPPRIYPHTSGLAINCLLYSYLLRLGLEYFTRADATNAHPDCTATIIIPPKHSISRR